MKRLWQRHRRWFLSVLAGLLLAALLSWWFTPRPELVVSLPEFPDRLKDACEYQFYGEHEIASRRFIRESPWVAVGVKTNKSAKPWPYEPGDEGRLGLQFINIHTGQTVRHPLRPNLPVPQTLLVAPSDSDTFDWDEYDKKHSAMRPRRFDATGRFLSSQWSKVRGRPMQVDWFKPDTGETGSIRVPDFGEPDEQHDSQISPDGGALVQAKSAERGKTLVRVFDLHTEAIRSECTLPHELDLPFCGLRVSSPERIAFSGWLGSTDKLTIYDTRSGRVVDGSNDSPVDMSGWSEGLSVPDQLTTIDSETDRLLVADYLADSLIVKNLSGKILGQHDAPGTRWSSVEPRFVPGSSGLIKAETADCPTYLEELIQPVLSKLNIKLPIEPNEGTIFTWYDWQSNEHREFRRKPRGEGLSESFVTRPNRVCLLADPKGENPRVEIWSAPPPPQRPVLAIWIASLLAACATWIWLRRRGAHVRGARNEASTA